MVLDTKNDKVEAWRFRHNPAILGTSRLLQKADGAHNRPEIKRDIHPRGSEQERHRHENFSL